KLPRDHRTAQEWKRALGDAAWERRFTFAFVRNPWDKVLSQYSFRLQRKDTALTAAGLDFNEWGRHAYGAPAPAFYGPKMFMPQADWICDESGRSLVDQVG